MEDYFLNLRNAHPFQGGWIRSAEGYFLNLKSMHPFQDNVGDVGMIPGLFC